MNIAFGNGNIQIINPEGGSCMKYIQDVFEAERIEERIRKQRNKRKLRIGLLLLVGIILAIYIALGMHPLFKGNIQAIVAAKTPEWENRVMYLLLLLLILLSFVAYLLFTNKERECIHLKNTISQLYEGVKDPRTKCFDKKETLLFLQQKFAEVEKVCKL